MFLFKNEAVLHEKDRHELMNSKKDYLTIETGLGSIILRPFYSEKPFISKNSFFQ